MYLPNILIKKIPISQGNLRDKNDLRQLKNDIKYNLDTIYNKKIEIFGFYH